MTDDIARRIAERMPLDMDEGMSTDNAIAIVRAELAPLLAAVDAVLEADALAVRKIMQSVDDDVYRLGETLLALAAARRGAERGQA